MLHKNLGGPEVFLTDCAGGDGYGELRRDEGYQIILDYSHLKVTRKAVSTIFKIFKTS